ncbi:MAG: Cytidylate kinase [Leptospirillum sp. Group IV 'UBA BS']|nr:MAG: Cytidylate kinase [Leptospirillum sp. Group IV 'UBA BS']
MSGARIDAIAIDGPASSGKSTLAREVARRLGFVFLDTGSLYRAVALAFLSAGVSRFVEEDPSVARILSSLDIAVTPGPTGARISLGGLDVTDQLRTEEVGALASRISAWPKVRMALFELQRRLALAGQIVMDGRDIGTVILPEARLKIFLVADPETRARRRQKDLESQGDCRPLETVLADILERDRRDRERPVSPLIQAPDALLLDTTRLSIDEAVTWIVDRYR